MMLIEVMMKSIGAGDKLFMMTSVFESATAAPIESPDTVLPSKTINALHPDTRTPPYTVS